MVNCVDKYNDTSGMSNCTEADNQVRAPEENYCLFDKSVLGACAQGQKLLSCSQGQELGQRAN